MKLCKIKDWFQILYREGTTDEKVIDEVLKRNVYEKKKLNFKIESNDIWLDCGANIGTFTLLCLYKKAKVYAFEPEPENYALLNENIRINNFEKGVKTFSCALFLENKKIPLYLCKGDYNKYRHSLFYKRGRPMIEVSVRSIFSILEKYPINCIKMDIEGSEIEILEHMQKHHLAKIKKMVFEYSFDFDKSIPRFLGICQKLKTIFSNVYYDKVKPNELEYNYFPACTLVFCQR